jgi:dephospho-CoA kinase
MSGQGRLVVAVGLTGGIGAGKTTALRLFHDLGAVTVSADEVVHALYSRPAVARQIAERFGEEVLDGAGGVDRSSLARLIRGRPAGLRWLEQLIHPLVAEEIDRNLRGAADGSVIVVEVPLLFEAGLDRLFDLVVTVEAQAEARRRRSVHGFGSAQFTELEERQATSDDRVSRSHLVFFNDGDLADLAEFVRQAYGLARERLEERR